jgi:hypothetical protein
MPTNFEEWDRRLRLASEKTVAEEILRFQKNLAFLTLGAAIELSPGNVKQILGVVLRTPVLSGRARASWNVSIGSMDLSIPEPGKGQYGHLTPEKAVAALQDLGLYDVVWISSGLPYITVLEYGGYPNPPAIGTWNPKLKQFEIRSAGGFSKQAPAGMLRITLDELEELFAA